MELPHCTHIIAALVGNTAGACRVLYANFQSARLKKGAMNRVFPLSDHRLMSALTAILPKLRLLLIYRHNPPAIW